LSRIAPALARRVDRLARRAHAFHRFAHHPLCDAYAPEVFRLGRTRACRGCALSAAGAAAGALAALLCPAPPLPALVVALALAVPAALFAVRAPRGGPRRSKILTRAGPLALAAALATFGLLSNSAGGAAVSAASVALVLVAVAAYRRRGPDRSPCIACPERRLPRICSGFRAVARREAAFSRAARRLLDMATSPPAQQSIPGRPDSPR
jgi:hypothetical protein